MIAHSSLSRFAAILFLTGATPVVAQSAVNSQRQVAHYKAITPENAEAFILKLKDEQSRMRAGQRRSFELLSGAIAFYPAFEISPWQSFLKMSFETPYLVERLANMGLWEHYQLTYFPPEHDALMWTVDVTIGQVGQLVRVEMLYTAPPPF